MNSARHGTVAAPLIATVLGFGLAGPVALAQQPAPPVAPTVMATTADPASEAAALQRLSEHFQARRAELDMQRQALREERARISMVDQPATSEQIAQWNDRHRAVERSPRRRHAVSTRLSARIAMLEGLLAALTPQTLQAISPSTERKYEFLSTDVGLRSTALGLRPASPYPAPVTHVPEKAGDGGGNQGPFSRQ